MTPEKMVKYLGYLDEVEFYEDCEEYFQKVLSPKLKPRTSFIVISTPWYDC